MTSCYNYLLLHISLPPPPPDIEIERYNALTATQILLISSYLDYSRDKKYEESTLSADATTSRAAVAVFEPSICSRNWLFEY